MTPPPPIGGSQPQPPAHVEKLLMRHLTQSTHFFVWYLEGNLQVPTTRLRRVARAEHAQPQPPPAPARTQSCRCTRTTTRRQHLHPRPRPYPPAQAACSAPPPRRSYVRAQPTQLRVAARRPPRQRQRQTLQPRLPRWRLVVPDARLRRAHRQRRQPPAAKAARKPHSAAASEPASVGSPSAVPVP